MIENKVLDLGKGPIFPLLLKMSWPSITAMLAMAVANLIDTFWLAQTQYPGPRRPDGLFSYPDDFRRHWRWNRSGGWLLRCTDVWRRTT